jgi:Uma2 family endonuclease
VLTTHSGEGVVPLESVALIVEVSDTTLGIDMGRKLSIYAEAGVPEYWVVDVEGRVIHQMWGTSGEGYSERREFGFGAVIEAATMAGVSVATVGLA